MDDLIQTLLDRQTILAALVRNRDIRHNSDSHYSAL